MSEDYLIIINLILIGYLIFQNLRQGRQIRELTEKLINRD